MCKHPEVNCPKCKESQRIRFPESFYFNRAILECEFCNLRIEGTGDSNLLAIQGLQEKLKNWKDGSEA